MPAYETAASAGMDMKAFLDSELCLQPMERKLIPTGIFLELPQGYEAQIRPRSGLALKHGITVLNSPGTIDADYRGEWMAIFTMINAGNINPKELLRQFPYELGDRVAQIYFEKVTPIEFKAVNLLEESDRGSGGFGSTGLS